jgi:hypothetical protein
MSLCPLRLCCRLSRQNAYLAECTAEEGCFVVDGVCCSEEQKQYRVEGAAKGM